MPFLSEISMSFCLLGTSILPITRGELISTPGGVLSYMRVCYIRIFRLWRFNNLRVMGIFDNVTLLLTFLFQTFLVLFLTLLLDPLCQIIKLFLVMLGLKLKVKTSVKKSMIFIVLGVCVEILFNLISIILS